MQNEMEVIETRERAGRKLDEQARECFRAGVHHLNESDYAEALPLLREAAGLAPENAQVRSSLGVAIAFVDRDFDVARTLCESAAKQEFFNPDLYLNLAHVYLGFGRRSEALRYLRRGQMIDPGHIAIQRMLARLGRRRSPIVPFLPRRHPLNRALGSARSFVMAPFVGR